MERAAGLGSRASLNTGRPGFLTLCWLRCPSNHPWSQAASRLWVARIAFHREPLTFYPGVAASLASMVRLLRTIVAALLSGFRSRGELMLENLALRQQLFTVLLKHRPRIGPADRAFWVALRRLRSRWSDAVVIVKPETVIGWHFALNWRWLSKRGRSPGRPAAGREVQDLVRRMASENGWGAPRIHGELVKRGFSVSERTVPATAQPVAGAEAELAHVPPEAQGGNRGYGLFHGADSDLSRPVCMVCHQAFPARNSTLEGHGEPHRIVGGPAVPRGVPLRRGQSQLEIPLFDRDTVFSAEVVAAVASMALEPKRTSNRSPWQNGVAERLVGSVRRELLDHIIVLDDLHLRRLLREYLFSLPFEVLGQPASLRLRLRRAPDANPYYHDDRTHLGVDKDAAMARPVERRLQVRRASMVNPESVACTAGTRGAWPRRRAPGTSPLALGRLASAPRQGWPGQPGFACRPKRQNLPAQRR